MPSVEPINNDLRRHATSAAWAHAGLVAWLHEWADRFIAEFRLEIPTPALAIDKIRRKWLGCYRTVRNGLGLLDEITIQSSHAENSPRWRVLGTLLHELLHEWQSVVHDRDPDSYGRGNFHDLELRTKARTLGLEMTTRGATTYPEGSTPFRVLLAAHGVDLNETTEPEPPPPPRSSLHLWECKCQPPVKLRVGKEGIRVQCLSCLKEFNFVK